MASPEAAAKASAALRRLWRDRSAAAQACECAAAAACMASIWRRSGRVASGSADASSSWRASAAWLRRAMSASSRFSMSSLCMLTYFRHATQSKCVGVPPARAASCNWITSRPAGMVRSFGNCPKMQGGRRHAAAWVISLLGWGAALTCSQQQRAGGPGRHAAPRQSRPGTPRAPQLPAASSQDPPLLQLWPPVPPPPAKTSQLSHTAATVPAASCASKVIHGPHGPHHTHQSLSAAALPVLLV